jgi:hypothetical protein
VAAFSRVTGRRYNPMTVPWPILGSAASLFAVASAVGLDTVIHPDRVMKLVQSTRVVPGWLRSQGYKFATNLEQALQHWCDETGGTFE